MFLLLAALLLQFSIFVQLILTCCFKSRQSEREPASSSPPLPLATPARSPEKEKTRRDELTEDKTQAEEMPSKHVKVRELADESQMSKSLKKVDSTEISNEVDDPFDVSQLPLPPPELRNSSRPPVISS